MKYFFLCLSVFSTAFYFIIINFLSKKYAKEDADYQYINLISCTVSMSLILICTIVIHVDTPSMYTVFLGLVFGIFTTLDNVFKMRALECGPMSYTSFITYSSMIIPAFSGWAIFGEKISVIKFIGVFLMLVAIYLSVCGQNNSGKKTNFRWLIFALISMLSSGMIGVLQKIHQNSYHRNELMYFLLVSFAFASALSFIMFVIDKRRSHASASIISAGKKVTLICASCGCFIAFSNVTNFYLSGVMNSIFFFPVVNGGVLILVMLVSFLFLHEKLSIIHRIGLTVGIVSIALLCFK